MEQQNQGTNSTLPVDAPLKRKRGRPRKDESQVKKERMTKSNSVSDTHRLGANRSNEDDDDDEMVGQVVSGVCEGSFDAGYFVTVKVGNTDTLLRGAVFVPGLFTPISAANDVAPYAKMYKRKEIPIPVLNPQVQGSSSAPRLRRKNKQPVLPENTTPMAIDQPPSSGIQCGTSLLIKTNSASTNVPLSYNVPKNDNASSAAEASGSLFDQPPSSDIPGGTSLPIKTNSISTNVPLTYIVPKNDNVGSSAEASGSLFAPQDQPASDRVPLTDNLPNIETVLSSGERVQGQTSTPDVPQKMLANQQEIGSLFALKDQCPSVLEPNNEAGISLGEKVQLKNQMAVVPDQVLPSQHHIAALHSLENSLITEPLTIDYLQKNDTDLPLEGDVPIENRVPISANQVLPIIQFGAPLIFEDQLPSVPVHPTHDLLKDERVLPQGEKVQHEKELPIDEGQVLLSDHPYGAALAVENQSASPVIFSAEKLQRKEDGFTLGGKDMPGEILELGLGDHPVSVTELKFFQKITKPDEMFQEVEASPLAKGPEADVCSTTELKLDAESRSCIDVFPGNETVIQMTQVRETVSPADEPKSQHLDLHLDPVVAEPEYTPFHLMDKPGDVLMDKKVSPKNDYPQYMQSEFTVKDLFSGNVAFHSNRSPFNYAMNVTGECSLSSIQQPMMNFPGDAEQTKLKLGAEGPEPPRMFEYHKSHPVDPAKDLDSGLKDAIISTKVEINPVPGTSINTITSEDVSQTEDDDQRAETEGQTAVGMPTLLSLSPGIEKEGKEG